MTNSKYYVIGTDAPQNDLNWLSALEFEIKLHFTQNCDKWQ